MYKLILALAIMTTIGAVQLPLALAAAPPQGGNPHGFTFSGQQLTSSTGNPHSSVAPKGNPHLCVTIIGGGGPGEGKQKVIQC
jgi:hypothetical protein